MGRIKQEDAIKKVALYITPERKNKAMSIYLYSYTIIEYKDKKPIEILEYFNGCSYYRDKVYAGDNGSGVDMYRTHKSTQLHIDRLINFEKNKPTIIVGKDYKITKYTESRQIQMSTTAHNVLKYFPHDKPYVNDGFYILYYKDGKR